MAKETKQNWKELSTAWFGQELSRLAFALMRDGLPSYLQGKLASGLQGGVLTVGGLHLRGHHRIVLWLTHHCHSGVVLRCSSQQGHSTFQEQTMGMASLHAWHSHRLGVRHPTWAPLPPQLPANGMENAAVDGPKIWPLSPTSEMLLRKGLGC